MSLIFRVFRGGREENKNERVDKLFVFLFLFIIFRCLLVSEFVQVHLFFSLLFDVFFSLIAFWRFGLVQVRFGCNKILTSKLGYDFFKRIFLKTRVQLFAINGVLLT